MVKRSLAAKLLGKEGSRRRRAAARVGGSLGMDMSGKSIATIGVIAAGAIFASESDYVQKMQIVKDQPYAIPVGLGGLALYIGKKKNKVWGLILAAVAAVLGVQKYRERNPTKKDTAGDTSGAIETVPVKMPDGSIEYMSASVAAKLGARPPADTGAAADQHEALRSRIYGPNA
jgi:hypothetical protein